MRGRGGQRGQAIVLIALMMAVMVGFVALAIDSARAFDGRRIMQDAVDNAALAAAEYYQNNPGGWSSAEAAAAAIFTADNRVYTSRSCNPGFVAPAPGAPGPPLMMTCTFGTTSYQLTITAEDDGPAGQTFLLTGQRSLDVALMQVLGQSPTLTVRAAGAATATDQGRTPVLAGLSSSGCYGATGTVPVNISSSTNPITIVGDVVANGTFGVSTSSYPHLAGNVLTRCAPPTNAPTQITYYCWPGAAPSAPGAAATPCTSPAVPGRLLTTAGHFADPGYSPPPPPAGTQPTPGSNVVLYPGLYATNPNFGSSSYNTCYFLDAGVYEWQAGMTVTRGVISNELKPPDEPVYSDNTTRSSQQFWDDNSAGCGGPSSGTCNVTTFTGCSISLGTGSLTGKGIANGTWSVVVTSLRTETINSVAFLRESAPSMCHQITVAGSDKTLAVTIANVPGADHYNVYASPPGGGGCSGPFGLVAANSIANSTVETEPALGGSLGTSSGTWNSDTLTNPGWAPDVNAAADHFKAYAPDSETAPWNGGTLPNQGPTRGTSSSAGDRANQNHCATSAGAFATCPSAVTPGAVVMYLTNNTCLNVASNLLPGSFLVGGDAYLFSGYQYDWLLAYEPPTTSCSNTWRGAVASAPIGLIYTPGAAVSIAGAGGFSSYTGGVVANSILIQAASGLLIEFSKSYAPAPGGTRLTG